jgi:hypothetical protein
MYQESPLHRALSLGPLRCIPQCMGPGRSSADPVAAGSARQAHAEPSDSSVPEPLLPHTPFQEQQAAGQEQQESEPMRAEYAPLYAPALKGRQPIRAGREARLAAIAWKGGRQGQAALVVWAHQLTTRQRSSSDRT